MVSQNLKKRTRKRCMEIRSDLKPLKGFSLYIYIYIYHIYVELIKSVIVDSFGINAKEPV